MSVGSSWRLRAGIAAIAIAACATVASPPADHSIVLASEKQSNGHYKAIAQPDRLTLGKEDFQVPHLVVVWNYHHKSTTITFQEGKLPSPACDDSKGVCTLEIPKNVPNGIYKYAITGKHDDANVLDPNDPDIEVDR